jgi:hypothetical protein
MRRYLLICLLVLACWWPAGAAVDPSAAVHAWLQARFPKLAPQLMAIDDPDVKAAFSTLTFFELIFQQYPVAHYNKGFSASNILGVDTTGQVLCYTSPAGLEAFFRQVPPVHTTAEAESVTRAWLRLSEVYDKGAWIQYESPRVSALLVDGHLESRGTAKVVPKSGDRGALDVELVFDPTGHVVHSREQRTAQPGIRPKCQATKLLDKDPIVRLMAEQDILVMGVRCRPYLLQIRSRSSKPLQRAIDRMLWQIDQHP